MGLLRLAQSLHREPDIRRLQQAPAFDLGVMAVLRKSFEIFLGGVRFSIKAQGSASEAWGLSVQLCLVSKQLRFNRKGALCCERHSMRCADRLQILADFRLMRDTVDKSSRRMGELR
jgi:hypothetical protein